MKHRWEEDERGDGMPTLFCRGCGETILAGAAGMGVGMGPMRGGLLGPKKSKLDEECPGRPGPEPKVDYAAGPWDEF